MPSSSPTHASGARGSRESESMGTSPAGPPSGAATENVPGAAALAPIPEAISVLPHPLPPSSSSLTASAHGRRTLSTAFVRVGPDGHLTVEQRDGRVLILRNVIMRAKDYCGIAVSGPAKVQYCGSYADVLAARPGG